ncbi:MAG: hypothetical protein JWP72_3498 [Massilia sp.]|nr:hypothetical protein [Massilia sp.]
MIRMDSPQRRIATSSRCCQAACDSPAPAQKNSGQTESNLYYFGASYPIGAFTVDAQVARRDTKNSESDVDMLVARLTYAMSKRTFVYTAIGRIDNDGASAVALDAGGTVGVGLAQTGVMVGLRHHF